MRCVVADDSGIVLARVEAYLKRGGHEVVGLARNGQVAYDLCKSLRPQIAIFDVSMPVMTGDIAAMKVKAESLAQYVIIASLQMQAATIEPTRAAGCHVIAKPFAEEKFLRELGLILGGAA